MSKKFVARGRHTVLPIIGDTAFELRIGRMTSLIFFSDEDGESELLIESSITLLRGTHERVLEGSLFGDKWNPRALGPLLEVIGHTVTDALAEHEGLLSISFSNELVMVVAPTPGYEGWHFHYPRQGHSLRETVKPIGMIGAGSWLA
ncbi:MAG: hypothetical protein FJ304_01985 [Planctomycetes bacterium]|nr:hypothetical protein [Planctomycetota bacterium]